MIEKWKKQLKELSGNLTTNHPMPQRLIDKLLEEDSSLKDKLVFEEVNFPKLDNGIFELQGLDILAGLQKLQKSDCVTLFRAMRMPTYKRIYNMVYEHGCSFSNFEQDRILDLYHEPDYLTKREEIKKDARFWTQPQERVVHGLPVFALINDTLQIHRAYRGQEDQIAIAVIHIPYTLINSEKIQLMANAAIDLDYHNDDRDFPIKDFVKEDNYYRINYGALRTRGIELHEMYTRDLPMDIKSAQELGIEQEFYLLDVYKVDETQVKSLRLELDNQILKEHEFFLHGFFGDQNIFGRRSSEYLPSKCYRIGKQV